jgi:amidophosphoribosyltransferase
VHKGKDTLVVIDDSIVRGTTLEKSILRMLNRLQPKKIVVVSSAPQIRFPDCYGIDMSRLGDFVAFRAVVQLLKEQGKDYLLGEVYEQCLQAKANKEPVNYVKRLFEQFSDEEISAKIADIVRPSEMTADLEIVFQTVQNLHKAIPDHSGDWYFTGNYPTRGGALVANQAYLNYMEGKLVRAY